MDRTEGRPDVLVARGRAYEDVGDTTRAEQYFVAAIAQGGDEQKILPLLLRVCVQTRQYRAAIEYAEPSLRRHPDDYHLRALVASIYAAVGDKGKAHDELERVVHDHPDDPMAQYALATLLLEDLHDRVAADPHFRAYLRLEPDGVHAEEARASLLHDVVPEAKTEPMQPVRIAPRDVPHEVTP